MASFTTIAVTGSRFRRFDPYVASLNDSGQVAFQATLADGTSAVLVGDGGELWSIPTPREVNSHPDIDEAGAVCFYGADRPPRTAVYIARSGELTELAVAEAGVIGPLGPTINRGGAVAYRATGEEGRPSIYLVADGAPVLVADSADHGGFEGLPVVTRDGAVVFRATSHDETVHTIHRWQQGAARLVCDTRGDLLELGRFPCANSSGEVVFAALLRGGGSGVFAHRDGERATLVDSGAGFESFRGAINNDAGDVFFYATPPGRGMGIFRLDGGEVLSIGDHMLDARVDAFALNPVSINECGQLAIRVVLSDQREAIVRAE